MRVGIGYDSHRFAAGRPLVLGGVTIPHDRGLDGWSDADAVCHALIDAILGAAAQGDIGQMFPPDNAKWKDASSLDLLRRASIKVAELGYSLAHADVTVIAEEPKLAPYVDEMREKLAEAAIAGFSNLSVKAKSNEGMGFVGRGEGIAVIAVALLEESRT
ncbi:MAG TPA: 2-C-methyl-D-erythritol 2,4-cyclodiphosphate synthase [Gemmatimonadales bacterium]|nr:2-C-methyl-D-erythritol 2,4-cyclodiphosphate synthase [Gemmatimonadales bacterium]